MTCKVDFDVDIELAVQLYFWTGLVSLPFGTWHHATHPPQMFPPCLSGCLPHATLLVVRIQ